MRPLCIYHGNCADGFGAAWAVRCAFPPEGVDFHAGVYQDPPPDVSGRDVILVDFSYKRPVLEAMARTARSILVLDHHKSAAEDLTGCKRAARDWQTHCANVAQDGFENADIEGAIIYALFDVDRSGAGLAWDFFHPTMPRPQLIDHIEDRDLWRFALDGTREIQAALFSYDYDFALWDYLMDELSIDELRDQGMVIERKHHKDVTELVAATRRTMTIAGAEVPVANLPYTYTSDAGQLLCQTPYPGTNDLPPFAACYWDTPAGRVFSLRSLPGGADVSAIARGYGGGGHEHAAGFRVAIGWEGDHA